MIFKTKPHKRVLRKRRNSTPRRVRKVEVCKKCGEPGAVGSRDKQGRPTCKKCCDLAYYHNTANHERCIDCDTVKPVSRRRNGWALCSSCGQKDPTFHENCFFCGNLRAVARYNSFDEPVCHSCSNKGYGGPPVHVGRRILEIRGIAPIKDLFWRFDSQAA